MPKGDLRPERPRKVLFLLEEAGDSVEFLPIREIMAPNWRLGNTPGSATEPSARRRLASRHLRQGQLPGGCMHSPSLRGGAAEWLAPRVGGLGAHPPSQGRTGLARYHVICANAQTTARGAAPLCRRPGQRGMACWGLAARHDGGGVRQTPGAWRAHAGARYHAICANAGIPARGAAPLCRRLGRRGTACCGLASRHDGGGVPATPGVWGAHVAARYHVICANATITASRAAPLCRRPGQRGMACWGLPAGHEGSSALERAGVGRVRVALGYHAICANAELTASGAAPPRCRPRTPFCIARPTQQRGDLRLTPILYSACMVCRLLLHVAAGEESQSWLDRTS